ncbi:MAG: RelA/SpoT domain-containing protein [Desulfomonile tiedjei]|nr:RelA/SpoT domain-containing protein [Desulfomonile tiedjei]
MNFSDYAEKYISVYEAFAETVRFILEKALLAADNLPRPQSVQCRAKGIESLRCRLVEEGKLDTQTLELDRHDLAGARLIFYTNNDVDRFLESALIRQNFEIGEDSTKIHHPTPENEGKPYRAIHYTVRLREDRIRLPEYARFAGLRCEIQVQTILDHAWSETSHDIIYKRRLGGGYGGKAMKGIVRRFKRIMDKYLKPAGYEIQKAQEDYERILMGKELFDGNIAYQLGNAQDNNERYEILSRLRDYAIPNHDNPLMVYQELKGPLLRAVGAARSTEPVPIETTYGNLEGLKADSITELVVEIIDNLRYVDVVGSLQLLIDIYRDEPNHKIRQQIVNAVKNLSEYNVDAYKVVGPGLQLALVDHLAGMSDTELDRIRPIAVTVWSEALQSDITSMRPKADSVVLSKAALPASDPLKVVRDKALKGLLAAYDRSCDDAQKRDVLAALDSATSTPRQVEYSNEFLAITLKDATRIVDFVTERAGAQSYELLQDLERRFLYKYFRAKELADDPENRCDCQKEAAVLVGAILRFRDTVNKDERYVRYKVLIGGESVYPGHWGEREFDKRAEEYRRGEADRYIDDIVAENETAWFDLMERCAETQSRDLGIFISKLGERKPEVGDRCLAKASDNLNNFLPGFLHGLAMSNRPDIYERILESELESARNLEGIASHLHFSGVDLAARLLKRAVDIGNAQAVIECLLFALKHYGTAKITDADALLRDALTFLNDRQDSRWVSRAWFLRKAPKFYKEVTPETTAQVLQNLAYVHQVNFDVEGVLVGFAERELEALWDYFGRRLDREAAYGDDEEDFEAVPFQFHGLEKELSKDPQLAIGKGLSWFVQDRRLFRFRGGHLLSIAFPNCSPEFAAALADLVKAGGDMEADFALAILQNYRGETSTYVVLKEIVSLFPQDPRKMTEVRISIDSTGIVSGDFGLAEAWRAKKESLTEWLADERPVVKAFAEKHIAELDRMIASEYRSAEAEREMRNRIYDEDGGESDDNAGNESEP